MRIGRALQIAEQVIAGEACRRRKTRKRIIMYHKGRCMTDIALPKAIDRREAARQFFQRVIGYIEQAQLLKIANLIGEFGEKVLI